MNILGALFPLRSFSDSKNPADSFSDRLPLSFARTCLLRGDADQCFRTLLFQAALSYASIGKRVAFYTPVPFQAIPSLVHSLIPASLASANLHLIQFHYLPSMADVHKHLVHVSSDIIILDGYLEFPLFKEEDQFHIMAACALLRDTYDYLREKFHNDNLTLLCSCTCAESAKVNVEQRGVFDLAIDIEMLEDGDYHAKVHLLSNEKISCGMTFRMGCDEIMPLFATVKLSEMADV